MAAAALAPAAAHAAVPDGRSIAVGIGSNSVTLAGDYSNGATATVQVERGGVVIGTASGTVIANELIIDEPGGAPVTCWDGPTTPDILPGDVVRVTGAGAQAGGDFDTVRALSADFPLSTATLVDGTGQITVVGRVDPAALAGGTTLDATLINPNRFQVNGSRRLTGSIRADVNPVTGAFAHTFVVTAADASGWKTTPGDATVDWALPVPAMPVGAEPPFIVSADPEGTECGPIAKTAITGADVAHTLGGTPTINQADVGTDMVVTGTAAPEVSTVTLDVGGRTLAPVTATAADGFGRKAWTVTVPAAMLAGLPDGPVGLTASYGGAGAPAPSTLAAVKDTTAPTLTADPAPDTFAAALSVGLVSDSADVRYTVDGPAPTASSASYTTPIALSTGTHTIRALAVDAAGNRTEASFTYTVQSPVAAAASAPARPAAPIRVRPRSVSLSLSSTRDRRAPYHYVVRGTVRRPSGVAAAACDGGRITATVKTGSRTLTSRRVTLDRACRFTVALNYARRSSLGNGRLKLSVRFLGSAGLSPLSAGSRTLRAG